VLGEDPHADALVLADEAEQRVLCADVVVVQAPRVVLREHDDLAGTLREAFEHVVS
jgi:hypothetical protein